MSLVRIASLSPGTIQDPLGNAQAGRAVQVYARGSNTILLPVYTDATGATQLPQPLVTDSDGNVPGYIASGVSADVLDTVTNERRELEPVSANDVGNISGTLVTAMTPRQIVGTMGADLGWAQPLTLASGHDTVQIGTLTRDLTVALTTPIQVGTALLEGLQDSAGGHVLAITDGNAPVYPAISMAPNAPWKVTVESQDGFTITVELGG